MNQVLLQNLICRKNSLIVEAMRLIDENTKGIVFVVDENEQMVGSLSDGDIRRHLIANGNLKATTESAMNREPIWLFESEKDKANEYMEQYEINILPILNVERKIIEFAYNSFGQQAKGGIEKKDGLKDTNVIIMAGGKGTRLYPYTKILPKPLIPIGDIPIVERIIDRFCSFGANNYYLTINYKKNMLRSYFEELNTDYTIHFVEESQPLGTAGSLCLIKENFDNPIIVTNCDILIKADYSEVLKYHKEMKYDMTIVSALKQITIPYGVLKAGKEGRVLGMDEKPTVSYFVNSGMYIINPELIRLIPSDTIFHMTDLADKLLKSDKKVGLYPISEEAFLDMGELEEMKRMEDKLKLQGEV